MNMFRFVFLLLPFLLLADLNNIKDKDFFFHSTFEEIVRFESLIFKEDTLDKSSLDNLQDIVKKIKIYKDNKKDIAISIIGHTSSTTDDKNEKIAESDTYANKIQSYFRNSLDGNESLSRSKKYAKYIQTYLTDKGIDENITVVEYRKGEDNSHSDETSLGSDLSNRVMLSIYVKINPKIDLDSDNDGVKNSIDKCPNTIAGTKIDSDGCKFKTIVMLLDNEKNKNAIVITTRKNYLVVDKENELVLIKSKYSTPRVSGSMSKEEMESLFGDALVSSSKNISKFTLYFNKKDLTDESAEQFLNILKIISNEKESYIQIIGHTDSVGKVEANEELARQRAGIVAQKIKDANISYLYLDVESYGEQNLAVKTADGVSEILNRRVEVLIR